MKRLSHSLRRGRGATATETVILIVLAAMIVLGGIKALQDVLGSKVDLANTGVSAVSTEDAKDQRWRENAKRARERRAAGGENAASASASGSAQQGEPGSSGSGSSNSAVLSDPNAPEPGGPAPGVRLGDAPEEEGGFNPFLIPIALGLVGLLGYVVVKSQKG